MTEPNQAVHGTDEGLIRAIGTGALGANVVNMVVGAGIFVYPGIMAAMLGPAAIFAYLACSVIVSLVFLCFAEVGSRVNRSGGAYAYISEAFGPFAGFLASILFWFGWSVFGDAAIAVAMTDALSTVVPELAKPVPRAGFLVALFTFLALINLFGVKSGMRLFLFNTVAKLVPLLLLVTVGLFVINFDNLVIVVWPTAEEFGAAILLLFFAFAGAESALSPSGEIKQPSKTIPRGLFLGIGGVLILYIAIQTVAQGVLGLALAENTETPLTATAISVFGHWGGALLLAGLIISAFGTLSSDVLSTPRVVFASARDGHLPKQLAKVHPKYQTPHVAIIFFAALGCAFALSGSFKQLLLVATGSILLIYLGVSLAVIRLRRRDGKPAGDQFRLPGGATIPLMSSGVIIWLFTRMKLDEAIGIASLLAVAGILYLVRLLFKKGGKQANTG
jgi:APA family basic amino acid/polyamine antiporter